MRATTRSTTYGHGKSGSASHWACRLLLAFCWLLAAVAKSQVPGAEPALPASQVLIGGALHTCTSLEPDNCLPDTVFAAADGAEEIVALAANRISASTRILQSLLEAGQSVSVEARPLLSLVTASSTNALAAVDFYRQLFEQLGFRVQWLPVDAVLATLLDQGLPCAALDSLRAAQPGADDSSPVHATLQAQQLAFCRDPTHELGLLNDAAVVFFNGGDQSLTLQALVTPDGSDRPWLALIRQRQQAGRLIVAGTSAGTAVHSSGEMLMGGDSAAALRFGSIEGNAFMPPADDAAIEGVLFHAQGSGLFAPGILDSHFSERGRLLRLLTLLRDSRASLAFGVDETTALLSEMVDATTLRLRVVGEAGVVILQRMQDGVRLHYMVEGDEALLQDGRFAFSNTQPVAVGTHELTLALDAASLERDALRDWLSGLVAEASVPARAQWGLSAVDSPQIELDFSIFSVLPAQRAGSRSGFHDLILRWRPL